MAVHFPEWSDLGQSADPIQAAWAARQMEYGRFRRYFDGSVFRDEVPLEVPLGQDAPLLFPVGLNLVRMLCLAQADALFGDWSDQVVKFSVGPEDELTDAHKEGVALIGQILRTSGANSMLWELELDRQVYGAAVLKVQPELNRPGHIRWTRIHLTSFYPVWNPDDPSDLLEVYVVTQLSADQARLRYGYAGGAEIVTRVEHWTKAEYTNTVDGKRIDAYSGVNPWGFVPFVYIPRLRTSSWWGDSLTEEVIPVQDELNMRIADLGESLNYNAHPVRWGYNLPREFNDQNYPLDPNSFWNLGRTLGNAPPPQVGLLEPKNPVPEGAFRYIDFVYNWGRIAAFAPPIAFGDDSGGSQRSGDTLEIRLWPLVKATRRSRSYFGEGLVRAVWMSGKMLAQKRFSDVGIRAVGKLLDGSLIPVFDNILPRDHKAAVDEVVKLMSTVPPAISLPTAVKILGRGNQEVEQIRSMVADTDFFPDGFNHKGEPANQLQNGLKGKATPQPGREKASP